MSNYIIEVLITTVGHMALYENIAADLCTSLIILVNILFGRQKGS